MLQLQDLYGKVSQTSCKNETPPIQYRCDGASIIAWPY